MRAEDQRGLPPSRVTDGSWLRKPRQKATFCSPRISSQPWRKRKVTGPACDLGSFKGAFVKSRAAGG